jgi:hypothetical protein
MIESTVRAAAVAAIALAVSSSRPAAAEPEILGTARWAAVELDVGRIDPGTDPLTLFVLATRAGMLVTPTIGFGLRAGVVHARGDVDSGTSLGNLTGDVYYVLYRSEEARSLRVFMTGSFSAPTATGTLASGAATLYWLPEPGLYHPDAFTARGAVTGILIAGVQTVEMELDLQHLFAGSNDEDLTRVRFETYAGFKLSARIGAFAALSTVWNADAESGDDHFLHWIDAGLSIDGQAGGVARIGAYVPLDEVTRDTLGILGGRITFTGTF